ncbi:hypothetical protein Ddye_027529 [Dipteronia dyeriana]|uniref:Uncharacterized protein n=1 Tax=Dipteronia dyeriana TaxID=168575 RepID=A0AAD9WQ94_9ROSI|nr:hypothetical protein Ddye_027529 [Dipteronia dyeriana]
MQRIKNHLALWKKKFLNKCGRLVLIKTVISSIPIYYMSMFKILVCVAHKIGKLQRNLFLGDGVEKIEIHVVDWTKIYKSKGNWGLGINRILYKNKGLLAKWVWRFGKEESSLWNKIICTKYGIMLWSYVRIGRVFLWPFFAKAIRSLYEEDTKTGKVLKKGLKVVVGRGDWA